MPTASQFGGRAGLEYDVSILKDVDLLLVILCKLLVSLQELGGYISKMIPLIPNRLYTRYPLDLWLEGVSKKLPKIDKYDFQIFIC